MPNITNTPNIVAIPKKMKGVQLTGHGGPEVLQYNQDIAVLSPKDHEVLIRVKAAGVNNTDINTRTAWYSKVMPMAQTQVGQATH